MSDPTKYEPKIEFTPKPTGRDVGWECPRCGSVNAPQIEKCKCVRDESKTESTNPDTRQLLNE